jgi:hypothetical protein
MSKKRMRFRLLLAACGLVLLGGCTETPKKPTSRYATLSNREFPKELQFLNDTIFQYTDLAGNEPFPVSGYGIVTHLHGTGGCRVSTPVYAAMLKELSRHDFGGVGSGLPSPEAFLHSKDVAIVRVDGYIPIGARCALDHGPDTVGTEWESSRYTSDARTAFGNDTSNQNGWCTWFDVRVSIPPESDATSLAHGTLYQTDLKVGGANPNDAGAGIVTINAQAQGDIFVNPSYVLDSNDASSAAIFSRKSGVILAGARALADRPLILRLRAPSARMARAIESRIIERFQDMNDDDLRSPSGADSATAKKIANAGGGADGLPADEGVVYVYVPKSYSGNWEHFSGIVRHLYLQGADPKFAATKARELADAAVLPQAPLQDISYCWEGLGKSALFAVEPLMSSTDQNVQYAAARAAAFLGDPAAVPVLLGIANTPGNPFRITAVKTLAELPATPRVDRLCRTLLDSDEAQVRIEAYKLLVKHQDTNSVYTRWVKNGTREKFALDIIPTTGKPMVYASRQGVPRLAVFGNSTQLELPLVFSTMDQRLTISSEPDASTVTIFYRGEELKKPVTVISTPSLAEVVSRLAGDDDAGPTGLRLGYADIVGIVQSMIDQQRVSGLNGQQRLLASFVLQDPPVDVETTPNSRALIRPDNGSRPQNDVPGPNEKPVDDHLLRHSDTGVTGVNGSAKGAIGPAAPSLDATGRPN